MSDKHEVVSIKVPKRFVRNGFELVIDEKKDGDCLISHLSSNSNGEHLCLIARPIKVKQKPDWNPPKLKKGWLTWEKDSGWYWWSTHPVYRSGYWTHNRSNSSKYSTCEEIVKMIAKFLDFPDCDGFDAKNCIWEITE